MGMAKGACLMLDAHHDDVSTCTLLFSGMFSDLLFRARLASYTFMADTHHAMLPEVLAVEVVLHPDMVIR